MMIFYVVLTILILVLYCALLVQYRKWFSQLEDYSSFPLLRNREISFSIIIPARNEESNIGKCLQSILDNHFDANQFEILVIDDFSEDKTAAIVQDFASHYPNVRLFSMKELIPDVAGLNSYKKKAIEIAIGRANSNWIITTDADCIVGSYWLASFADHIARKKDVFIAAPVQFINKGSFLDIFQCLDFLSLQGITAASVGAGFHSMCNGANLCYKKDAFQAVEGFKGVDKLASGDDMFLMHKIKKNYPGQTGYLFDKRAIVGTLPMPNFSSFLNQRIRWASKADSYQDKKIIVVLAGVYLINLLLLIGLFVSIFHPPFVLVWLAMLALKIIFEIYFLRPVARFFSCKPLLLYFPLMEIPHIIYTVLAGFLGKFGKYQWKGRTVK